MKLPVPSPEKQQEVVSEYDTVVNRIKLNQELTQKVEETAQTLYRHWFVDFEFPISKDYAGLIGKPELEGKPYKSSGGEMVYNKMLDKLVPMHWEISNLTKVASYLNGLAMQKYPSTHKSSLPVLKIRELNLGYCDEKSSSCNEEVPLKYIIENGDVVFSWSGTLAIKIWSGGKCGLNQHLFKISSEVYPKWFYFQWTKFHLDQFIRIAEGNKTSMGHIKRGDLEKATVLVPSSVEINRMNKFFKPLFDLRMNRQVENNKLKDIGELLLSKMSKSHIDSVYEIH